MDGGAWWAAVYGVAQSLIRLKWLTSSSSSTRKTPRLIVLSLMVFFSYQWIHVRSSAWPLGWLLGCNPLGCKVLFYIAWGTPISGFPRWLSGKRICLPMQEMQKTCIWFLDWIPWRRNGNPLLYFCQETPMDRGAPQATVHKVTKRQTWLTWLSMRAWMWKKFNIENV